MNKDPQPTNVRVLAASGDLRELLALDAATQPLVLECSGSQLNPQANSSYVLVLISSVPIYQFTRTLDRLLREQYIFFVRICTSICTSNEPTVDSSRVRIRVKAAKVMKKSGSDSAKKECIRKELRERGTRRKEKSRIDTRQRREPL